jgi:hypothetical protein
MKVILYIAFLYAFTFLTLQAQSLQVQFSDIDPRLTLQPNAPALYFTREGYVYSFNPVNEPNWSESGPFAFGKFFWDEDKLLTEKPAEYYKKYTKRLSRSVSERVKLYFPVPSDMLYSKVDLKWLQFKNTHTYHVYVTDRFNHVLMRKATTDTVLTVDFSEYNAQKGVCYFWYVEPDDNKEERSDEICLTWVEDQIRIFVLEELDRIITIPGQHPVQMHILKAGLLEQHKLYIDALKEYKQAVELAPDADDIKRMYAMFLVRIGLIKNVQEIYN